MRLYVNGDSHAAAAEAVNTFCFAEDEQRYFYMGRNPHPDNAAVSWARRVAEATKCRLDLDAESASSNQRILRTTREWISTNAEHVRDTLIILQWSTWERQEWFINDVYYQVTASGTDDVPDTDRERYKRYIADVDWNRCCQQWHDNIWRLHLDLTHAGCPHIFFNGNSSFAGITESDQRDWGISYIEPYSKAGTYDQWLKNNGFSTVTPESWHFGPEAHAAWARFMLQYIVNNHLLG